MLWSSNRLYQASTLSILEIRGEDIQEVIEPLWYKDEFSIDEEGNAVVEIQLVLLGSRAKAFMARSSIETLSADDDKSNVCADRGASNAIHDNH